MYALRALSDENYEAGREAKLAGRPVAWCMADMGFYGPLLNAIDIESVYPENYGPVCAAAGAAQPFLDRCEAEGYPTHMCGYMRNCLGYTARMMDLGGEIPPEAPRGGMPKPTLLLGAGTTCDTRFKCFQALGRYLDAPMWVLEFPHIGTADSLKEDIYEREINFLIKEVRGLVEFLEGFAGRKLDWDKLERDIEQTKEMQEVLYQIGELRKARPCPMHSRDWFSSMNASLYRAKDYAAVTELYRKMLDEVKYRVDNKIAGINREEKYRLVMASIPPWHTMGFFDQLAERGWNFVMEGYHAGRPRNVDLSMYSDPVECFVRRRYPNLRNHIEGDYEPEEAARIIEELKQGGSSRRLSHQYIRDYQADGVFLHPVLTCRPATAGLYQLQTDLMEMWKLPCLVIEGDIVDTRLFNLADALRKAEAFEDTMDHYRKVRQEAGLE